MHNGTKRGDPGKVLQNAYPLARIGFDTAENERPEASSKIKIFGGP